MYFSYAYLNCTWCNTQFCFAMQVRYYSLFDDNAGVKKPLSRLIEATAVSHLRIMNPKRERKRGHRIYYLYAVWNTKWNFIMYYLKYYYVNEVYVTCGEKTYCLFAKAVII